MAGTSAFYTGSEDVLQRQVAPTGSQTPADLLDEIYEITRSILWIQKYGFKRVALQFPDELMQDAVGVTQRLETATPSGCTVFILGDTSYGSCCVDEVAAEHYNAESIIHYGRSCLSQPVKMPVLFVYGKLPLDVDNCVAAFVALFPDKTSKVVIMYDTVYAHASDAVYSLLKERYTNVIASHLGSPNVQNTSEYSTVSKCSREFCIPCDQTVEDYSVFYIGEESLTLTNLFYNCPSCQFFSYNPVTREGKKESVNVNKMLMKRFYMIEKAKDAKIVGILVGTLGVRNYLDVLNRLKVLIKKAGKKSYVFIVGKINVAKLANFMEVDLYVLIACSENTLLDSSEFYRPVVTPYEMEIACNPKREWTGEYITDFAQLLEGGTSYCPIPESGSQIETDISLVTGKIRNLGQDDTGVETGTAVMLRSESMTVATQAESAGEFLSMRSWQGLEQKLGETPVTTAIEGQKGIAAGYTNETS